MTIDQAGALLRPGVAPGPVITHASTADIRFPTSRFLDGSDAMNPDPDYSAAYVVLSADGLEGHGLAFTLGRGTDLVVAAIDALLPQVIGRSLDGIENDLAGFWRSLVGDSQYRWLGPEKGIIHLATAAIVNAVWDMLARRAGKPLWRYLADMPPEQIVSAIDFRHIADALPPSLALDLLKRNLADKPARIARLEAEGHAAYTTSAGWLGYDDDKIRRLANAAIADGWSAIKMKVGGNLADDIRRCGVLRDVLGPDRLLMIETRDGFGLFAFDILGHGRIRQAVSPIRVATGEHCHNRVMFKQFLQAGAIDVVQIDACRLGGVNEVLSVLLLAAAFDNPVCPHAGGVGLCEYVQHLSFFDAAAVASSAEGRMIEHAGHLHEHFIDPIRIRAGRYLAPERPGYSVEMKDASRAEYRFPDGSAWKA